MTLVKTDPLPVTYQLLHPREETSRTGTAGKISFSGVVITAPELPPLGSILQLSINAEAKTVRMFAEVKWHNPKDDPPSFGAFFLMPTTGRMLDLIDLHVGGALDPPETE
ncbi:MAG: PilZ domain-containing protein [Deltaproteobacteria bacterium]|nr:PilZ domain-containing protein [Deltaproteobacteria bacterium]